MKKVYQVIPYDGYDEDKCNIKTFINEKDALKYKKYLELKQSMYSNCDVEIKELELVESFDEKHFEEKIYYGNISYVFNENLRRFDLQYIKLESCTLSEFEEMNRLEYKRSDMGIYKKLKDVICMNLPCHFNIDPDRLEQKSSYILSKILDKYKRIIKEQESIDIRGNLVIFEDVFQKAVKNIADTL